MWDTVYLDKTSPPAARPWPRPELIILPQCILCSPNLCFNSRLILLILNCTHWKTAALSSSTILFLSTSHFSVVRCQLQFLAHFRYKPWLRCRSANEWWHSKGSIPSSWDISTYTHRPVSRVCTSPCPISGEERAMCPCGVWSRYRGR